MAAGLRVWFGWTCLGLALLALIGGCVPASGRRTATSRPEPASSLIDG